VQLLSALHVAPSLLATHDPLRQCRFALQSLSLAQVVKHALLLQA
jgi:hypothetical protein